jgi:hypothetical protein
MKSAVVKGLNLPIPRILVIEVRKVRGWKWVPRARIVEYGHSFRPGFFVIFIDLNTEIDANIRVWIVAVPS